MTRNRLAMVAVLVLAAGCGCSPVKYDAIHDTSSDFVHLQSRPLPGDQPMEMRLTLLFTGKGKHPSSFRPSLHIDHERLSSEPAKFKKVSKLEIIPGSLSKEFTGFTTTAPAQSSLRKTDRVMYDFPIDDLVYLLDYGGKLEADGVSFVLSPDDIARIKEGITVVREATGGR